MGYYGFEVMDTCRPGADTEAGDADLSLLSYLDCHENAYKEYAKRVPEADYRNSFNYLAFHTPFSGMVKGAHRSVMRKIVRAPAAEIETDIEQRVSPGLTFCRRVGNIMGGAVFLSLASTIYNANMESARRVGCFSYGSGCCSEFYSGVVTPDGAGKLKAMGIDKSLDARYLLSLEEYDEMLNENCNVRVGTRNTEMPEHPAHLSLKQSVGKPVLVLKKINEFHREYEWIS